MRQSSIVRCALATAVGVLVASSGAAARSSQSAALTQVATLSPPGGQVADRAPSVSGSSLLVAGGWVFEQPAGGWASEPPEAQVAHESTAISDDTAVGQSTAPGGVPPFTETVTVAPPGGWHGMIGPAAQLSASDGALLQAPQISGDTIVTAGYDPSSTTIPLGAAYVFVKPTGGWSGVISQTAKLMLPGGRVPSSVAISGSTIVLTDNSKGWVFVRPAGGWAGAIGPSAILVDHPWEGDPITISDNTVVDANAVFQEPSRGWSGTITPTARLVPRSPVSVPGPDSLASSGELVAA